MPNQKRGGIFAIVTFGLLTILGCNDTEEIKPPPPEAYIIEEDKFGDSPMSAALLREARSYEHYEEFAEGIRNAPAIEVFEGLPHQTFESELMESELKTKETIEIAGYNFYARPVIISERDKEQLTDLYCTKETFVPFRGIKNCGGYHPDWLVRWKKGEEEWIAHFCFGCHEAITIHGDESMYCDIWAIEPFERLLNPYHQHRPEME